MMNGFKHDFELVPKFPTFLVGGAVRDELLKTTCKDLDFVMLCPTFDALTEEVIRLGCDIKVSKPEFVTIRAVHPSLGGVDFALARTDGESSDQRRPDSVGVTLDLETDLSRRDFTIGAMARNVVTGELVDPFGGREDLNARLIRSVGFPLKRLKEDSLRAFRALRFAVTKEFEIHCRLMASIRMLTSRDFTSVSTDRIQSELEKMFKHDTLSSMSMLVNEFPNLADIAFKDRELWSMVSSKQK